MSRDVVKHLRKPKCKGLDNARRCRRNAYVRGLCRKHYERSRRKGGETRTERELRAIRAKAERRARLVALAKEIECRKNSPGK